VKILSYKLNDLKLSNVLERPGIAGTNKAYAEILHRFFVLPQNSIYILGAGTSVQKTPLWYEFKKKLAEYIIKLPDDVFYNEDYAAHELKKELLEFVPDDRFGTLYNKVLSTDEEIIRIIYQALLLEGIKNLISSPEYNPYSIFSFTNRCSPFLNFNQDGLLNLVVDEFRIFEPHGSVFSSLKNILEPYQGSFLKMDLYDSEYSEFYDRIEARQRTLIENASANYALLKKQGSPNKRPHGGVDLILPYDDEHTANGLDDQFVNKFCGHVFEAEFEEEHSEFLAQVRYENRHIPTWRRIENTVQLSENVITIGYSFSEYDHTLIEILRTKLGDRKLIVINSDAKNLSKKLSSEFRTKNIVPIEIDWYEFITTMKKKEFFH
jgi:hypothetical protein